MKTDLRPSSPSNILLGIGFIILLMAGLWVVDVSVSAMINQPRCNGTTVMTNGFYNMSPIQAYHVGLYFIFISGACLTVLTCFQIKTHKPKVK